MTAAISTPTTANSPDDSLACTDDPGDDIAGTSDGCRPSLMLVSCEAFVTQGHP